MTLQDLLIELYEMTGSRSDLSPYDETVDPAVFDITQPGAVRLIKWLNLALTAVCTWKFPDGRIIRFQNLKGDLNFQTKTVSGTLASATATTAVLDTSAGSTDGQYNDWLLKITGGTGSGQIAYIQDYTGASKTATISYQGVTTGWPVTPDSTSTYTLMKSFYRLIPPTNTIGTSANWIAADNISFPYEALSPTKIYDHKQRREIFPGLDKDYFFTYVNYVGDPTQFRYAERTIWFDRVIDDNRWLKLYYVKNPPKLVAATDVPNIPENWHIALVYWASSYAKSRDRDWTGAYAMSSKFKEFMQTTRKDTELYTEDEELYVVLGGA